MIKKVILDTDLGSDVDDVGAVALANIFHNENKIQLLAITHTTSGKFGPLVVEAINEYYGNKDIEVGVYKGPSFMEEELPNNYPEVTAKAFNHKHQKVEDIEDSVKVLRRNISLNRDVTLIFVGQLLNLRDLLLSKPDEYSSLNGEDLINSNVKEIYIMGGKFSEITGIPASDNDGEYNLKTAIDASLYVFDHLKVKTTFIDGTLGFQVVCGSSIVKQNKETNIVGYAYDHYIYKNPDGSRFAWDPITVYRACIKDDYFVEVGPGIATLDKEGRTEFKKDEKGNFYVVKANKSFDEISTMLDKYLLKEGKK